MILTEISSVDTAMGQHTRVRGMVGIQSELVSL